MHYKALCSNCFYGCNEYELLPIDECGHSHLKLSIYWCFLLITLLQGRSTSGRNLYEIKFGGDWKKNCTVYEWKALRFGAKDFGHNALLYCTFDF